VYPKQAYVDGRSAVSPVPVGVPLVILLMGAAEEPATEGADDESFWVDSIDDKSSCLLLCC
jgi:hypothetical protein